MGNYVITIARQYGSGGRTVGQMLADRLGIPLYDKNILRMASDDSGIHEKFFTRVDEYNSVKPPVFGKSAIYKGELIPPQSKEFVSDKNLFNYQAKIIRELAEKESCVIVGRCADYILKDCADCLRVFIHADMESRAKRIVEQYGERSESPEKRLRDKDKRRAAYYQFYTDMKWGLAQNYHITLNSAALGIDKCVEILADLYHYRRENHE